MAPKAPFAKIQKNGKYVVMLVEDNPKTNDSTAEIIESTGNYQAIKAYNGEEAINLFKKNQPFLKWSDNKIAAIVLDIMMPKMDGLETIKAIRAEEGKLQHVTPIIMLTAYEDPEKIEVVTEVGTGMACAYLKKDTDMDKLIPTLDRAILKGEWEYMIDDLYETGLKRRRELGEKQVMIE